MTKKLVNFRVDSTLWENYQNYCKSIGITATESIINHINFTLSDDKNCKDNNDNVKTQCKDINDNVKTECKDNNDNVKTECKDINKHNKVIESIKTQLFNQQINIDNQINLLTQRIDKLANDNDSLKQENINLDNELKLLEKNQDKLLNKLINYQEENNKKLSLLPVGESVKMLPEHSLVDPPVETINYSSLTVAQLKNNLDQLGISYRKKALKSDLINLLLEK
jgi:DNA repair exonuclease SbcCD ATPase subunit